jgi:ABC-2 family transporter
MTTDSTSPASTHHRPGPAAILIVPVIVAIVLTLFAWPSAKVGPRDVPIGVAGPAVVTQPLERTLAAQDGAFDVHRYDSEQAARAAIADRDVYGAFVASPGGMKLLTASAGSPAVTQMLTHAASETGAPVQVEDVVAAQPGSGALQASVLPLVIAGLLTAVLASALATSALRRTGLVLAGSVLAGLVATLIVQSWLEVVDGDWLTNAGVLSLTVLAIASVTAGLEALLGKVGILVGALTMILVGNPFSGVATGPEMLPTGAGSLGQLLPPGAGGNLLRSTGFFDGAAAGQHVAVLVTWVLAGLALLLVAAARSRRVAPRAVALAS